MGSVPACRMEIARNGLKIEEENDVLGVNAKVDYFTLPGEKIGALVRRVELTNTTGEYAKIEVLDGMPARTLKYGRPSFTSSTCIHALDVWHIFFILSIPTPYGISAGMPF